jgi:hypothetical protein
MSRVVNVVHPTLANYVPRGARKAVTAVVATTTLATLTEADPASFRWLKTLDYTTPVMEHEGRLWRSLPIHGGYAGADELAAFLSAPDGGHPLRNAYAFEGTPIVAMRHEAEGWRGLPETVLHGSRQANLGTEVTAARVKAFLDENVRIAGDRAYVRSDILFCGNHSTRACHRVVNPAGMTAQGILGHPADLKEMWEHFVGTVGGVTPSLSSSKGAFTREHKGLHFDLVPAGAEIAPTVAHFARQLARAIEEKSAEPVLSKPRRDLKALLEDNASLWFDAGTGMAGADRLHEVLDLYAKYTSLLAGSWHAHYPEALRRTANYVGKVLSPRVAPPPGEPEPDAGDIEALMDLGPAR